MNLTEQQKPKVQKSKEKPVPKTNQTAPAHQSEKMFAIVRVRGTVKTPHYVKCTMEFLRLERTNYCVIVPATPSYAGMIQKVKDCVTWGEADESTIKLLKEKLGEQKFYRLNPPRKGFGRKGIKTPFNKSGALGYRGEKINDLVARMVQ